MTGIRVVVAFACGVDLALIGLLFQRVGRFFIPKWQMRLLMVSAMTVTASIGLTNLQHVHQHPAWYTWAIAAGMVCKAAAMGSLVHWYGSTAGRRHTDAMLASSGHVQPPRSAIERRVDQLFLGVIAIFAIAMFTLLVIGVSSYRTNQDQRRTNSALCSLRNDLAQRYNASIAYMAAHPQHIIFGVPRGTLLSQLQNQKLTLNALGRLRC